MGSRLLKPDHTLLKGDHLIYMLSIMRLRKEIRLSPNGRAVLSYLAFRARKARGATGKGISAALRMHRTRTVPKAINELMLLNLIVKKKSSYRCVNLTEDVFMPNRRTWVDDWTRRYAFWFMRLPESNSPVTLIQAMMLGYIENRVSQPRRVTMSYGLLSTCLGISKQQARYNYERLVKMNLVETVKRMGGAFISKIKPLDEVTKKYFRPEKARVKAPAVEDHGCYKAGSRQEKWYKRLTEGRYSFTANQARQIITWMEEDSSIMLVYDALKDMAKNAHLENVEKGKYVAEKDDYYRLFWSFMVKHIARKREWKEKAIDHWKRYR